MYADIQNQTFVHVMAACMPAKAHTTQLLILPYHYKQQALAADRARAQFIPALVTYRWHISF
jgi:hypothetical protein